MSERPAYRLEQLELFNWGPFHGLHRAAIDPDGSAVIGQTGSGKTTLVDAFMTLIVERPLYNLASTGGHESDRDLVSYIRGVTGEGAGEGETDHIGRPGATTTAIAARLGNGEQTAHLVCLLWFDSSSAALADLKRLWVFGQNLDEGLVEWVDRLHREDVKGLKRHLRSLDNVYPFEKKSAYLTRIARFFEVSSTAFALLNRAAGLKQLNSIDALFRELVLEDNSAFDKAKETVAGFDNVKEIHAELETARRQQQALLPIAAEEQQRVERQQRQERLDQLKRAAPRWFSAQGLTLIQARLAELDSEHRRLDAEQQTRQTQVDEQEAQVEARYRDYIEQGGGDIEQLQQLIAQTEREQRTLARNLQDYSALAQHLGLDPASDRVGFDANQARAAELAEQTSAEREQERDAAFRLGGQLHTLETEAKALDAELREARAHPSNIEGKYLLFRQQLAEAIGLPEGELAYLAELVEVRPEEQAWRGAIERAIGSHRLRLIVPEAQMRAALAWVNGRDNRLHVRLLDEGRYQQRGEFLADGFTRKLAYKEHPRREAAKALLAEIDRHCVDDSDTLHRTPHAMTRAGLMSGAEGRFDKQDQRPLNQGWMTGFDNRDRLRQLEASLAETRQQRDTLAAQFTSQSKRVDTLDQRLKLIEQLRQLHYEQIDLASVEARLAQHQSRLADLQAPDSAAARARAAWAQAKETLRTLQLALGRLQTELALIARKRDELSARQSQLRRRLEAGLGSEQQAQAQQRFGSLKAEQLEQLDELERHALAQLQEELDATTRQLGQSEKRLIGLMGQAKRVDTGALAEVGLTIADIPPYLTELERLTQEALPEKLDRFLAYLNDTSDQGVTQLLATVENEVSAIEERIEELNRTLEIVDFKPGSYLRLEAARVRHQSLHALQQGQRELRSAALKEDQGESQFSALIALVEQLREAVDKRKTLAARALLDPRHRLQFRVAEVARATGHVIDSKSGSQGGSGGEKESITSYILTASLSYALCPAGAGRPLFASVVLDEAFSKSSQAVAARIIEALRQFGLHPLFITPNKEMRLLRAHTRSAILVHRKGPRATLTSLSWQELDELAWLRLKGR